MSSRDAYHTEKFGPAFLDEYQRENIRIERLLEIGSGPSPSGVISAGKHCKNITLSDYSTGNLLHLMNWHESKVDLHPNVLKMFHDVSRLENKSVQELDCRTRKSVQKIIFADLLYTEVIPENDAKFDFILVNFAFLNACMNVEDLEKAMKNVYNKLVKGGYLFLQENNKHSELLVDGKAYHNLMVDGKLIEEAAAKAGFTVSNITEELRNIVFSQHVTLTLGKESRSYKTKCDDYKYFKVGTNNPCKDLKVFVKQEKGEPNLYISKEPEKYPTISKMVWSSYEQGNDTVIIKSWEPSYKHGQYYIGVHAYCGSDVPTGNRTAEFTVTASEQDHVIEPMPDLWVKREDNGIIDKKKYKYHRMCVPSECFDINVTISHCTEGRHCTSYGYPELLVSKNNPEVKVKDEAWKLAEGKTRSVRLRPNDVNMDAGHYYIGIYGWCTEDELCPQPPKPNCGPCSKAGNVSYTIKVARSSISKKKCEKILKERKNSSNVSEISAVFILLGLIAKMIV
ncbi:DgyrCDS2021 [Dimorphilus gyrociliatus]|uniref:DgyrCDS2021 n=1 Tax=Dimorphilus gyrociliatus TaxID=2664684 RepID=A0A7I8VB00_9ANNE|nr:DgyrCDS2021 [Dimorphilus gyrociliatus]